LPTCVLVVHLKLREGLIEFASEQSHVREYMRNTRRVRGNCITT
jgi:hypothetical protein